MKKPDKQDYAAIQDLDRFLKRQKLTAAKEIRQLFCHVLLGEEIDPFVAQKWRQLGFLSKDDKVIVSPDYDKHMAAELVTMSLAYMGIVKLDRVPIPEP